MTDIYSRYKNRPQYFRAVPILEWTRLQPWSACSLKGPETSHDWKIASCLMLIIRDNRTSSEMLSHLGVMFSWEAVIRAVQRGELRRKHAEWFRVNGFVPAGWCVAVSQSLCVCVAEACLRLVWVITRWQGCGIVATSKPHSPQVIWLLSKPTLRLPPKKHLGVCAQPNWLRSVYNRWQSLRAVCNFLKKSEFAGHKTKTSIFLVSPGIMLT